METLAKVVVVWVLVNIIVPGGDGSPAIPLDYGETLVLLTDGVTEAANNNEFPGKFKARLAMPYPS